MSTNDKPADQPLSGRHALLTDALSASGRAIALGLAGLGARISVVGPDLRRTEAMADEIRAACRRRVTVFVADLSSLSQVRRLADDVLERLPRTDVLVNNTNGHWDTRQLTDDGLERTLAVNHLAPFLLTNLLLDRLKQSAGGRVVTVSAPGSVGGRIDFDDLGGERDYSGARAFDQSRLAGMLFTYELARRVGDTSMTANAAAYGSDPGTVARLLRRKPGRGASTSIHVASAAALERVTGRYFDDERRSAVIPDDEAVAARLWQVSADLVGLTAPTQPH